VIKSRGYTAKSLSEKIGVSHQYISQITTGKASVGLKFIYHLIETFPDIDLNYLIKGESIEEVINNRGNMNKEIYAQLLNEMKNKDDIIKEKDTQIKKLQELLLNLSKK
jgi:transcriptional regulator with XRE-family HTH domain